jgi:UDP-N-acetylmuramyl pentapeptide phosphotransferase/UDP-N-acetylglucosamine-1-phosphate transferase
MNRFFDWLKDSGTQAILILLGTISAFVAAFAAIYFGRKSLTKNDLAPIEQNTAHLDEVRSGTGGGVTNVLNTWSFYLVWRKHT